MERIILLMALIGFIYLVWKGVISVSGFFQKEGVGGLLKSKPKFLHDTLGINQAPIVKEMAVRHEGGEIDWSLYDVPAWQRKGIPAPTLLALSAKVPKTTRKRRNRAVSETSSASPAMPAMAAAFEVIA
jgi:hypothetical protein